MHDFIEIKQHSKEAASTSAGPHRHMGDLRLVIIDTGQAYIEAHQTEIKDLSVTPTKRRTKDHYVVMDVTESDLINLRDFLNTRYPTLPPDQYLIPYKHFPDIEIDGAIAKAKELNLKYPCLDFSIDRENDSILVKGHPAYISAFRKEANL